MSKYTMAYTEIMSGNGIKPTRKQKTHLTREQVESKIQLTQSSATLTQMLRDLKRGNWQRSFPNSKKYPDYHTIKTIVWYRMENHKKEELVNRYNYGNKRAELAKATLHATPEQLEKIENILANA